MKFSWNKEATNRDFAKPENDDFVKSRSMNHGADYFIRKSRKKARNALFYE